MRFVFVVTFGRSGSTAVQKVLNAVPGWCIRGENGNILPLLVTAAARARTTRQNRKGERDPHHPWYGGDCIRPEAFRRNPARVFVNQVLAPPPGTEVTGFKEIRHTPDLMDEPSFFQTMEFLLTAFGPAQLVLLSRDPALVARSSWWAQSADAETLIRQTITRLDQTAARWPEQCYRIDHAQFDRTPEGMRPLLNWLGADLPAAQLAEVLSPRLNHATLGSPPP